MADLDFGGLAALSGLDSWQEKRQAKESEQQRLFLLNQMANADLQQEQQSGAAIQEYLNTVGKIKVLDQDKQRIADRDQELRAVIMEGIKKYQGNAKKYLQSGGMNELNKYRENLLNSKEVETGLMNAINYNRYTIDKQAGLTSRPVTWTADGKNKIGGFAEQYEDFTNGKTNTLGYGGGFKLPAFDDKIFQERYGNPERSYQAVGAPDFYNEAMMQFKDLPQGDRELAAAYHLQNYAQRVAQGGTPLAYKFDDPSVKKSRDLRDQLAIAKLQMAEQKLMGKMGGNDFWGELAGGGNAAPHPMKFDQNAYANMYGLPYNEQALGQMVDIPTSITPINDDKLKKDIAEMQGLSYSTKDAVFRGKIPLANEAISYVNGMPIKGKLNDFDYDVKNVKGIVHVPSPDNNPSKQRNYMLVDVNLSTGDAEDIGIWDEHGIFRDSENALSQGFAKKEGKGVTIPLLVPVAPPTYEMQIFNNKYKKPAEMGSAYGEAYNFLHSPSQSGYLNDAVEEDSDDSTEKEEE